MPKRDPRVDAYIAKSADFAKPILNHLRKLVHAACPEVEETLKWSMPHFLHKGILCSMAAFKQHCTFGFWKRQLIFENGKGAAEEEAHGQFGRLTSVADLPADKVLIGCIKKAVQLNDAGVKSPSPARPKARTELVIPPELTAALKKNKKALSAFEQFSYSHKKEYVQWITEAKREATRKQRLATTVEWLAEGKPRHWKYAGC
jgi:uncharacterized protein YdeI (YjbR/CyaY-like superfamily)